MTTLMPRDADGAVVPALRLRPGGAHTVSVTATSARNVTAFSSATQVVSICATGPVFIRTGKSDVTAATTDHYLPAGTVEVLALGDARRDRHTHIAVVRAEYDCTLYISERE